MNDLKKHYQPINFSDKVALAFTKFLRFLADTFFKKRYGHRAVVLETVAAVPGIGIRGLIVYREIDFMRGSDVLKSFR